MESDTLARRLLYFVDSHAHKLVNEAIRSATLWIRTRRNHKYDLCKLHIRIIARIKGDLRTFCKCFEIQ